MNKAQKETKEYMQQRDRKKDDRKEVKIIPLGSDRHSDV